MKIVRDIVIIFLLAIALCIIGLLSQYSASYTLGGIGRQNFAARQSLWLIISIAIFFLVARSDYRSWLDKAYILFLANIGFLVFVLAAGSARLGAKRWIDLGAFLFQPSELCKLTYILALVRYITGKRNRLEKASDYIIPFLMTIIPVFLIIQQPDLGTAFVFLPLFLIIMFMGGAKKRFLSLPILAGIISSPVLWNMLRPYQKDRILAFLDPNRDPLGTGYTVIQSQIAVGSGGILGKGWMAGTQNYLNFLPERHTDFIFSIIGEEWGFLGGILVLILYALLLFKLLKIADYTSDPGGKLLVTAAVTLLWFHVVVNIAMVMGLLPVVGLPLPFLTYGGSNLMTTYIILGLAINIYNKTIRY